MKDGNFLLYRCTISAEAQLTTDDATAQEFTDLLDQRVDAFVNGLRAEFPDLEIRSAT